MIEILYKMYHSSYTKSVALDVFVVVLIVQYKMYLFINKYYPIQLQFAHCYLCVYFKI